MDTAAMQLTITNLAMVCMATGDLLIRWVHTGTAAVGAVQSRELMLTTQRPRHTQFLRYLRVGKVMAVEDTADVRPNKVLSICNYY